MTTETLDKLYLEWSQFTNARTAREIGLLDFIKNIAGLDDRYLLSTNILKQWRDDAREFLSEAGGE
jgi:hypothetical protein